MKLYKVINKNKKSKYGDFDWSDYLPRGKRPGKWTPEIPKDEIDMCMKGYHLTPYWNMWVDHKDDMIFEAEAKEVVETGYDKVVCTSVRLVRRVIPDYDTEMNTGNGNTGHWNTGNGNTGHFNTGNGNTGHRNAGDFNTGDFNTGDFNAGGFNAGNRNTGNRNAGDFNAGDFNTGFLNTTTPPVRIFNRETDVPREDIEFPGYFYFILNPDLGYKNSWIKSLEEADPEDVAKTLKLPNFDYEIFEEISGISREMIEGKICGKTIDEIAKEESKEDHSKLVAIIKNLKHAWEDLDKLSAPNPNAIENAMNTLDCLISDLENMEGVVE